MAPPRCLATPRSLASAPEPAIGLPVVVTAGQNCAHSPVQAVVVPWSLVYMYTVRCFGPAYRIEPRDVCLTPTVTLEDAWCLPAASAMPVPIAPAAIKTARPAVKARLVGMMD